MKRFLWVLIPLAILLGSLPWLLQSQGPPVPIAAPAPPGAAPPARIPVVAPAPEPSPPAPPPKSVYARILEAFRADDMAMLKALRDELLAGATPAPVTDPENGALAYLAAFEKIAPGFPLGASGVRALQKGRATAADVDFLRDLVARNGEAIQALKSAAAFERCRYPVDYREGSAQQLPHLGPMRSAFMLLAAEAFVLEQEGRDASASRIALGKLGDSLREESLLESQLRRHWALGTSGSGDPSSIRPVLVACLHVDLAALLTMEVDFHPGFLREPGTRFEEHVAAVEKAAALVLRPWHEAKDALTELAKSANVGEQQRGGSLDFLPGLIRVAQSGAWAEAALNPAIDPFSGNPMVSRNGLIFSVGPNGVDDGGALDDIVVHR